MVVKCATRSDIDTARRSIQDILGYSKALRCTIFEERKKLCSLKFAQLELLFKRVRARLSKNTCSLRFSLHKSANLKLFWTLQLETVA